MSETRLREAGLRVTRPRRLVLGAMEHLGGHRSADDVAEHLGALGERLSRQSVYNVLVDLARVGLLSLAEVGAGATRYELADHDHHHFVCRVCGRVLDVDGPAPSLSVPGASVESASVVLRGVCAGCRVR